MRSNRPTEITEIENRYARRNGTPHDRYSPFQPEVLAGIQERQRQLVLLLKEQGISRLDAIDVLEIGCGTGSNLLELVLLGADPKRLVGNELLKERFIEARSRLPEAIQLLQGDATTLNLEEGSFDVVYQSTVFSSILDDEFSTKLARQMWKWVRPGGGILWYDFIYDNPKNSDVKGVPLGRIRQLFPGAKISFKRVTLAPPISRKVVSVHSSMYALFNQAAFLRTHVLCWVQKAR